MTLSGQSDMLLSQWAVRSRCRHNGTVFAGSVWFVQASDPDDARRRALELQPSLAGHELRVDPSPGNNVNPYRLPHWPVEAPAVIG